MKDFGDKTLEAIEPFPRGAMVHFAHKLCNGLAGKFGNVRLIGSSEFELKSLNQDYELVEEFHIPREDMVTKHGVLGKLSTAWLRFLLTVRFIYHYRRAVDRLVRRKPEFSLVATIFRYPLMGYYLGRMKRNGVKCLQICHEFQLREERKSWKSRLLNWSNRKAYQQFHAIFFLSDSQRAGFRAAYPKIDACRLFVIRHGNAELFGEIKSNSTANAVAKQYGISVDRQKIIFFGRIRRDKGVEDMVAAMHLLKASSSKLPQLILAGHTRPELLARLRKEIEKLDLNSDVVIFPDYVPTEDVWHLMSMSTIAVFPYRSSSQSGALQVAMACEKAIVASDVGGIPEVVKHNISALIIPPESPASLAAALRQILDSEELAKRLAKNAFLESQTTYGWDTVAGQMVTSLKTLENIAN